MRLLSIAVVLLPLALVVAGCGGDNLSLCDGCPSPSPETPTPTPTVTSTALTPTPTGATPIAPTATP